MARPTFQMQIELSAASRAGASPGYWQRLKHHCRVWRLRRRIDTLLTEHEIGRQMIKNDQAWLDRLEVEATRLQIELACMGELEGGKCAH
jgi:hypothetical protein